MEEEKTKYNITQIIIGIIVAVAVIGIIVISIMTYLKTKSDEESIFTLREHLAALQNQLGTTRTDLASLADQVADADSRITDLSDKESSDVASLQDDLTSANSQIFSLTNQIDTILLQISSLQHAVTSDTGIVGTIETQLSLIAADLSSLGDTTTALQTTLTSLENTVDSLISQVNELTQAASNPVVLFTSRTITQPFSTQTLLHTFAPTYSGNIYISGTSSSTTGYIRVTNNSTSTFTDYPFGTGTTVNAIVMGGYSYSIRFGNTEGSGTVTATLSAVYYPFSSTSNSVTLFSSQTINQAASTQTIIYNYTPASNGYIYFSGTSSSTTSYIRVTNNTTSTFTDYPFGTGTTVNAVVNAGHNYTIRFGNTEGAGTVTAILSAIYYY